MKCGIFPVLLIGALGVFAVSTHAALVITPQPAPLTVNAGSTATFSVGTTNAGPITCQWQFKGANLPGQTNLTLLIENVSLTQAGPYRAILSGPTATNTSSSATLTVLQGTIVRFALATGNIDVELFDHDKAATVQNFLHYLHKGLYTNTFFHRLVPNFELQGGGYSTTNRDSTVINFSNLVDTTDAASLSGEYFPDYILNEFDCGPAIRNTRGTLAMARIADPDTGAIYTNSANAQWFFNLNDNSTNRDNQSGGFTVFGRVTAGENVMQSFNSLSSGEGIVDLVVLSGDTNAAVFSNLPVLPTASQGVVRNSDLYYANISILSGGKPDKTPPTISFAYPANGAFLTNGRVLFRGKAADDNAVESVLIATRRAPVFSNESPVDSYYPFSALTNVNGDASVTWGTRATYDLVPGSYVAVAFAIDAHGNISANDSAPVWGGYWRSGAHISFIITTTVTVNDSQGGTVTPNLNGKQMEVGKVYKVTAVPKPGWMFAQWTATWPVTGSTNQSATLTTSALNFAMRDGLTLTPAFASNYFTKIQGAYSGLFSPTNAVDATNSGSFTLTTTASGGFNGYLLLAGKRITLSGGFDYAGNVKLTGVKIPNSTNTLSVNMSLDLTNGTGTVTGTVSGRGWTSELLGYLGTKKLATPVLAGKYIVTLPSAPDATNQPVGDGYAVVTVTSPGLVSISGKVADGAVFSSASTVGQGGQYPVYGSLYDGKGVIIGWQNLTNANSPIQWVKPASLGGAYSGFSTVLPSTGGAYLQPKTPAAYQITLDGGPLDHAAAGTVTIDPAGKCVMAAELAKPLTLSLSVSTSVFSGKYTPAVGTPVMLSGAYQSPATGGTGFFTNSAGLSGRFEVVPK